MSAEKQLQSVREKIQKILPLMEEFLQEHYTPLSTDASRFKNELGELLDELTVYYHYISKREISSSFHIHSAVSSHADKLENSAETKPSKIPEENDTSQMQEITIEPSNQNSPPPHGDPVPIPLSLNDRFRVLKELFKNSELEWNTAWQQFSLCSSREDILEYLKSLKNLYGWKDTDHLYQLLEKACLKKFS